MDNTAPTGLDLKVERVTARVKQKRLADQMGVDASRVSAIEREQFPSEAMVKRYRDALAQCQNVPHAASAA